MMTKNGLDEQARALAEDNGLSPARAAEYSALIGDTPELASDGRVIVRDLRGIEIARVKLRVAGGQPPATKKEDAAGRFTGATGIVIEKDQILLDDSSLDDPLAGPAQE